MEHNQWDTIFTQYAKPFTSPEGKVTFESSEKLVHELIKILEAHPEDIIMDIGCGWGNLTLEIAPFVKEVIAIEPSRKNLESAKKAAEKHELTNIQFIHGSFEKLSFKGKLDKAVTSLVFHQVPRSKQQKALDNLYFLLAPGGTLTFCDPLLFFDPLTEPATFNEVYRYLLPKTMPEKLYKKYVEPQFQKYPDYIYTWEDMKKYTPKDDRFYTFTDLKRLLQTAGFQIDHIHELAPFFGIVHAIKPVN